MNSQADPPARWLSVVLPIGLVVMWYLVGLLDVIHTPLFAAPVAVVRQAWQLIANGQLEAAVVASVVRAMVGFLIGALLGVLTGLVLGLSPLWQRLIGPSLNTFKQISLFAWIPLLSVWFGLGEGAKIVFLTLAAFIPVALNTCDGVRQVPVNFREVGRVYQLGRWQTFTTIIFPAAIPSIFIGIYLSLMFTWMATIGAEYLLSSGIGVTSILLDGSENSIMPMVIVAMIVIGLVGWLLNASAGYFERKLMRRYGRL